MPKKTASTTIEDEFAFLDLPQGGIALDCEAGSIATESKDGVSNDDRERNLVMNPITGSICDTDDIDSMLLSVNDAKQQLDDLKSYEDMLRRRLGELAEGKTKTRRVRGKSHVGKIEMPDDGWDQTILKESWNSYPQFRDEFLKIATIGVKAVEFKKLREMSTDDAAFGSFKSMLEASVRPATGAPRVTMEK